MIRISVIIPAYNNAKLVRQAIQSVLDQSYRAIELIVVDDGSTDNTAQVIATIDAPILTYIHQANRGVAAARNAGACAATGEYLIFLDQDDLLLPTCLEVYAEFLQSHPTIGLA